MSCLFAQIDSLPCFSPDTVFLLSRGQPLCDGHHVHVRLIKHNSVVPFFFSFSSIKLFFTTVLLITRGSMFGTTLDLANGNSVSENLEKPKKSGFDF